MASLIAILFCLLRGCSGGGGLDRIVGGMPAKEGQFPYQVRMELKSKSIVYKSTPS